VRVPAHPPETDGSDFLGEIGFHQQDFNRHMQHFIDRLGIQPRARVLVPLCGKSRDMVWLADRGYRVTGIEISERAVIDFFEENGLSREIEHKTDAVIYRGESVHLICADFFTVGREDLPHIDAVYDRASLVALPPEMRPLYALHIASLMVPGTCSLLVTLEYPQEEMRGPPFSVTRDEVLRLFAGQYGIENLHSEDCLAREPRFQKKGLSKLDEQVYLLRKLIVE